MNNLGRYWEIEAYRFLHLKKHYKLVRANFYCRFGEIDLIVRKGKYIVFVEVKQRDYASIGKPMEAVSRKKQENLIAAAKFFLARNNPDELQPRFDVVEVYTENNQIKFINHLENAFDLY